MHRKQLYIWTERAHAGWIPRPILELSVDFFGGAAMINMVRGAPGWLGQGQQADDRRIVNWR